MGCGGVCLPMQRRSLWWWCLPCRVCLRGGVCCLMLGRAYGGGVCRVGCVCVFTVPCCFLRLVLSVWGLCLVALSGVFGCALLLFASGLVGLGSLSGRAFSSLLFWLCPFCFGWVIFFKGQSQNKRLYKARPAFSPQPFAPSRKNQRREHPKTP